MTPDEIVRQAAEKRIGDMAEALRQELAENDAKRPERRVHTATLVVTDDGRFLAMNGSAHQMGDCFRQLFEHRPELRGVVQQVLEEMYRIADR